MKRPACLVGCCLLLILELIYHIRPPVPYHDSSVSNAVIRISGTVDDKYHKDKAAYLVIRDSGFLSGAASEEKHDVIVKLDNEIPDLKEAPAIGESVVIEGRGLLFSEARNPGNFDMARYEMIRDIDLEIYGGSIVSVYRDRRNGFREALCLLRERLAASIDRVYDDDEAGIIKAMLLGDRADLDDETKDSYRRAGMSHILCISALHISLIGMTVLKMLERMRVKKMMRYGSTITLIILYGELTGMEASTVRAIITFGLMMTADLCGRTPDILSSMSEAGTVMMLMKPIRILDTGFILSYMAICGIGLLGPPLKRLIPARGTVFDSLRGSLSVTLFMMPAVLYFFFQMPLFSLMINLLVIPLLGPLIASAVLSMAAGMWAVLPGRMAGIPARMILLVYEGLTGLNDSLPGSLITTGRPEAWRIGIYYLIIVGDAVWVNRSLKGRAGRDGVRAVRVRIASVCALACATGILITHVRPELSLTMIDVGQGDCHLLEISGRRTVMIDCGSSDTDEAARYRVLPYVLSRGYDRIDYAVVTHTDEDHINGYAELLDMDQGGLKIGAFIMPEIREKDGAYMELVSQAEEKGIEVMTIKGGDTFTLGGVRFDCLNPVEGVSYSDVNASSVCLSVSYAGSDFKALYTGDVQDEGESEMLRQLRSADKGAASEYTLLKCAHHGSRNSTSDEFLRTVRPLYTFISAGVNSRYGHPHKELMDRLKACGTGIYVTSSCGAVRLDTDGHRIRIYRFIDEEMKGKG